MEQALQATLPLQAGRDSMHGVERSLPSLLWDAVDLVDSIAVQHNGESEVEVIPLQAVGGQPAGVRRLTSDSLLWDHYRHSVASVPPCLEGAHYVVSRSQDFAAVNPQYLTCTFKTAMRVYVLWHNRQQAPKWLRRRFSRCMRGDTADAQETVSVAVNWRFSPVRRTLYLLTQQFDNMLHASLDVWELNDELPANTALALGGLEGADLADLTYVLAFVKPQGARKVRLELIDTEAAVLERTAGMRAMLNDELAAAVADDRLAVARRLVAAGADVTMTVGPHGSKGLIAVAAENGNVPMLAWLVSAGAELSYAALLFLLHNSDEVPPEYGGSAEPLLVQYMCTRWQPIACGMAIAAAYGEEAAIDIARSQELLEVGDRFHDAAIEMVNQLGSYEQAADEDLARRNKFALHEILDPAIQSPATINEMSPFSIAFAQHDTDFTNADIVKAFCYKRWVGREYALQALQPKRVGQNGAEVPPLHNHDYAVHIFTAMGFCGELGLPLLTASMHLLHLCIFASRQFFDSPRGRFCMAALSDVLFLVLFHALLATPPSDAFSWRHALFIIFVLGHLLEMTTKLLMKYEGRLAAYGRNPFNVLRTISTLMFASCGVLRIAAWCVSNAATEAELTKAVHMIFAASAAIVYLRMLGNLVPLHPSMGPLLHVILSMAQEVMFFLVPFLTVVIGFATVLHAVFGPHAAEGIQVASFVDFPSALIQLGQVLLQQFDLTLFDNSTDFAYLVYGKAVLIIYVVLTAVLLANMLIALISNKFSPGTAAAQASFELAELVEAYQDVVDNHEICAPFNIVQLLLGWLGSGERGKVSGTLLTETFAQLPFDGIVLPGDAARRYPIGCNEVPYLCFLLTLYPLLHVAQLALWFLTLPYAAAFYALSGLMSTAPPAPKQHASGSHTLAAFIGPHSMRRSQSMRARPLLRVAVPRLPRQARRTARYLLAAPFTFTLGILLYGGVCGVLLWGVWCLAYGWLGKLCFTVLQIVRGGLRWPLRQCSNSGNGNACLAASRHGQRRPAGNQVAATGSQHGTSLRDTFAAASAAKEVALAIHDSPPGKASSFAADVSAKAALLGGSGAGRELRSSSSTGAGTSGRDDNIAAVHGSEGVARHTSSSLDGMFGSARQAGETEAARATAALRARLRSRQPYLAASLVARALRNQGFATPADALEEPGCQPELAGAVESGESAGLAAVDAKVNAALARISSLQGQLAEVLAGQAQLARALQKLG